MSVAKKASIILSHCLVEAKVNELATGDIIIEDEDFINDQKIRAGFAMTGLMLKYYSHFYKVKIIHN